jgi:hypothetical protein
MNTDPEQIRGEIDAILAKIPSIEPHTSETLDAEIDVVGHWLDEAHQVLVRALESVEKG